MQSILYPEKSLDIYEINCNSKNAAFATFVAPSRLALNLLGPRDGGLECGEVNVELGVASALHQRVFPFLQGRQRIGRGLVIHDHTIGFFSLAFLNKD